MTWSAIRAALACAVVSAVAVAGLADAASAQQNTVKGDRYVPTIWVDPDGCEHWVMDDGAEGFMSPHLDRRGNPVCHRGQVCGVMPTDQFFATNGAQIHANTRQNLESFFRKANARAYLVHGHTDSRASDEYNMNLSYRRANAVARVAQSVGARISDIRGYGERMPKASNTSAAGMAQNRRVEIICIR